MINTILIFGNLAAPMVAGLFFFIFFLYFILAQPSRAVSYRYFAIYLISFSIFLIGRPLQLLLGPYPMPLIINNLRLLLFCAICSPMALLATGFFSRKRLRQREIILIGFGLLLGVIYCIFNTLGTSGTYEAFRIGNIVAHDNLTPSLRGPYYGREVTLAVQVIAGICLSLSTGLRILRYRKRIAWQNVRQDKFFVTSIGTFFFGLFLAIGTLSKQWWLSYLGSMVSAMILGGGVLLDIKEVRLRMEKVIPFVKEDLIQNMTLMGAPEEKISEMLSILGKQNIIDTFLVLKINDQDLAGSKILEAHGEVSEVIRKKFDEELGEENYLMMFLGSSRIGTCFRALNALQKDQRFILDLAEKVREDVERRTAYTVTIGIGRSYDRLENLRFSYREALDAQEYADNIGKNQVIHVNDILRSERKRDKYPFEKKDELLGAIRLGNVKNALQVLEEFLDLFDNFCKGEIKVLKVRMYQLIGSIIDSAILGGGDDEKLHDLGIGYFDTIDKLKDIKGAEAWLGMVIRETVGEVANSRSDKAGSLIGKAKKYIEKNYQSQILVEDVAREVSISPSYFKHLFKQESGFTFSDYLTKVRIRKAKELLLNSDLNITEIAFETGYQNSNYFSIVFKNLEGISPSEYRKNNKNAS
jgi:two-component system, response regulator YesN